MGTFTSYTGWSEMMCNFSNRCHNFTNMNLNFIFRMPKEQGLKFFPSKFQPCRRIYPCVSFSTESYVSTKRQFHRIYPKLIILQYKTIKCNVEKVRETGSVKDQIKGHWLKTFSIRTPKRIEVVREALQASPKRSTC